MKKVAIVVVAIIAFAGLRLYYRSSDDQDVLTDIKAVISELEVYDANAEYIDALVDHHHARAFNDAYTMGGRRRRATFDEQVYLKKLFDGMVIACRHDKRDDVADALNELGSALLAASAEGS